MLNLSSDSYYGEQANCEYMSVSQFKEFQNCEAAALAHMNGEYIPEVTDALLVGSFVDAYFEGTLDAWKEEHPEIFMKSGELKAQYRHAETMINRVKRDDFFMRGMSGEKQVIMTGEIAGSPYKIKIDSLLSNAIVDLKTVKDFELIWNPLSKKREHFILHWGYDIQGAVYREIVRQNVEKLLPFYIFAVTKEKPEPDLEAFWLPESYLESALAVVKELTPRFQKIKNGELQPTRCGNCAYCRRTKKLKAPIDFTAQMEVYNADE